MICQKTWRELWPLLLTYTLVMELMLVPAIALWPDLEVIAKKLGPVMGIGKLLGNSVVRQFLDLAKHRGGERLVERHRALLRALQRRPDQRLLQVRRREAVGPLRDLGREALQVEVRVEARGERRPGQDLAAVGTPLFRFRQPDVEDAVEPRWPLQQCLVDPARVVGRRDDQ